MALLPKTIGVVGGLSPETGFRFGLELNNCFLRVADHQPSLLVDNVPVPKELENSIILGNNVDGMLELLRDSVARLNLARVDLIVIPCNTAHIFIDELRIGSDANILSIIEETAKECEARGMKRIGLLATGTSVKTELHKREFSKRGINIILPDKVEQSLLNGMIIRIIKNRPAQEDKKDILSIVKSLEISGAEAVILGCTDLQALVSQSDCKLPVIDTFSILRESTLEFLNETKPIDERKP